MNSGLKNILIFGVGAILGGASTYYLVKERIKATYEQVMEEEISSMREYIRKKEEKITEEDKENKDTNGEVSATDSNLKPVVIKDSDKTREARNKSRREYHKAVETLGYTKPNNRIDENSNAEGDVNGSDGVEDNDNSEEEDLAAKYEQLSMESSKKSGDGPYVIDEEQFNEECDHFEKLTIYYYEDDDVLADENEQVIPDVSRTIGDDALDNFGYRSGDPEVVYVRNEDYQIDYEVIRLSKSYAESVLGYDNP